MRLSRANKTRAILWGMAATSRTRLRIVYQRAANGWWAASIPSVPGVFSQGRTKAEAERNVLLALAAAARAYAMRGPRSRTRVA